MDVDAIVHSRPHSPGSSHIASAAHPHMTMWLDPAASIPPDAQRHSDHDDHQRREDHGGAEVHVPVTLSITARSSSPDSPDGVRAPPCPSGRTHASLANADACCSRAEMKAYPTGITCPHDTA